MQIGEWFSDDAKPLIASDVFDAAKDHQEEMGASITCVLCHYDENNQQVGAAKVIQVRRESIKADSLFSSPEELTGDSAAQSAQAQRHLEMVMRMTMQHLNTMFVQSKTLSDHLMDLVEKQSEQLAEAESRQREAERHTEELEVVLSDMAEGGGEVSEAQSRIVKLLEPVLTSIAAKMLMGGTGGGTTGGTGT